MAANRRRAKERENRAKVGKMEGQKEGKGSKGIRQAEREGEEDSSR